MSDHAQPIAQPVLQTDTQIQVTGSSLVALLDLAQKDPEYKLGDLLDMIFKQLKEGYLDRKRNEEYHQAVRKVRANQGCYRSP